MSDLEDAMRRANETNRKMLIRQSLGLLESTATMLEVLVKVETDNKTMSNERANTFARVALSIRNNAEAIKTEMKGDL